MIIHPPAFLYFGISNPQFVYELLDPDTRECRYIGKTKHLKKRYKAHLQQSKKSRTHKECWVASLLKQNKKPIMQVVAITTSELVNETETSLILKGKNLTNLTLGGDGQSNITQSTKNKIKITKYKKRNSLKHLIKDKNKPVVAYNTITGDITTFINTIVASKTIGISQSNLAKYCRKLPKSNTCKNYILRYIGY